MASIRINTLSENVGTIINLDQSSIYAPVDLLSENNPLEKIDKYAVVVDGKQVVFTSQADRDALMSAIKTALSATDV